MERKPTKRDWREGTQLQAATLCRVWLEKREMGRDVGRSTVSEVIWERNRRAFENFARQPEWVVRDLAYQEACERSRRALAAHRDTVDKPSRRKAGEMV